ncbi:unnamed protein product [Arctogadus glacialis]
MSKFCCHSGSVRRENNVTWFIMLSRTGDESLATVTVTTAWWMTPVVLGMAGSPIVLGMAGSPVVGTGGSPGHRAATVWPLNTWREVTWCEGALVGPSPGVAFLAFMASGRWITRSLETTGGLPGVPTKVSFSVG